MLFSAPNCLIGFEWQRCDAVVDVHVDARRLPAVLPHLNNFGLEVLFVF